METYLRITNSSWQSIYEIPQSTILLKGRHGLYHAMVEAAAQVLQRFGCYAWGTADCLFYVGSFSKDYKGGRHKSNLHGRIHNYLQNHRLKENGRMNTNLMVFGNINAALQAGAVSLYLFRFDFLEIGQEKVDYVEYANDPDLVRAVEQLLICSYKRNQQCVWNRE
jgi:hypothetical protein